MKIFVFRLLLNDYYFFFLRFEIFIMIGFDFVLVFCLFWVFLVRIKIIGKIENWLKFNKSRMKMCMICGVIERDVRVNCYSKVLL